MKTTHKGFSTATGIIIAVIVIILIAIAVFAFKPASTVAPVNTNGNETATTTPNATTTESVNVTVNPSTPELKIYANATLGFSFTYPRDFFLKTEGFSKTNGTWNASFISDRGEIIVHVAKGPINTTETKLQTVTTKIGTKEATQYNTRGNDGCDTAVANSSLDTEYGLQFRFKSCGDKLGAIYADKEDSAAVLASVKFTNVNTNLLVLTKQGFAFRYPSTWGKPTQTTTGALTKFMFGQDLEMQVGPQYSTNLKRNLAYNEVVTGALTIPGTVKQDITVDGKPGALLTTTPTSGAKQRTVYISNKSTTDLIILSQKGVDAEGLNLVINSFNFIK
jgi:hypothetical protein